MKTVTQARAGAVRGTEDDGIVVFRGIPYAEAPVGARRFRPAVAVTDWSGELDATRFGPVAPQPPVPLAGAGGGAPLVEHEDCLTVNVWTPAVGGDRRPVMVWIHGGGFVLGSGQAALASFARNGVVVVSMNYRLGALGFAVVDGVTNVGLSDHLAALAWVHDNIDAFGGDPDDVTIFGCSAGGMSVCSLIAAPAARGLFHKAIAQSGAGSSVSTMDQAVELSEKLFAELGVRPDDLEALRDVDAQRLVEVQQRVANPNTIPFRPVVDGITLPAVPLDAVRSGRGAPVPLIIGWNRDEMKLLAMAEDFAATAPVVGDDLLAAYGANHPGFAEVDVVSRVRTDEMFAIPAIRFAEAHAGVQPRTWMYRFEWETPAWGGVLGACHGLEVPFALNALHGHAGIPVGDDPPQRLADAMHTAWTSFAVTGDPNQAGLAGWPTYDTSARATMRFDDPPAVVHDPDATDRRLWDDRPDPVH